MTKKKKKWRKIIRQIRKRPHFRSLYINSYKYSQSASKHARLSCQCNGANKKSGLNFLGNCHRNIKIITRENLYTLLNICSVLRVLCTFMNIMVDVFKQRRKILFFLLHHIHDLSWENLSTPCRDDKFALKSHFWELVCMKVVPIYIYWVKCLLKKDEEEKDTCWEKFSFFKEIVKGKLFTNKHCHEKWVSTYRLKLLLINYVTHCKFLKNEKIRS